jgi:hypothetical protein
MPEGITKAVAIGGLLAVGAVVGALLWARLQPPDLQPPVLQPPDEERPPIIVEDGSVHVGPQHPSSANVWGEWTRQGSSLVWHYDHQLAATDLRTGVFNGVCTTPVGLPSWRHGPIRISYTNGTNTYSFALLITNGVTMVRTNRNEPEPTIDQATPWRLDFGGAVRLSALASEGGSTADTCTFSGNGRAAIMVEQQR